MRKNQSTTSAIAGFTQKEIKAAARAGEFAEEQRQRARDAYAGPSLEEIDNAQQSYREVGVWVDVDHILPQSRFGRMDEAWNLRLLTGTQNSLRAAHLDCELPWDPIRLPVPADVSSSVVARAWRLDRNLQDEGFDWDPERIEEHRQRTQEGFKNMSDEARERIRENAQKVLQKWREENPEEVRDISRKNLKKWREENPEEFYEATQKGIQKAIEWQEENPEKHREQRRKGLQKAHEWREENPEEARDISRKNGRKAPEIRRKAIEVSRALEPDDVCWARVRYWAGRCGELVGKTTFSELAGQFNVALSTISFAVNHEGDSPSTYADVPGPTGKRDWRDNFSNRFRAFAATHCDLDPEALVRAFATRLSEESSDMKAAA